MWSPGNFQIVNSFATIVADADGDYGLLLTVQAQTSTSLSDVQLWLYPGTGGTTDPPRDRQAEFPAITQNADGSFTVQYQFTLTDADWGNTFTPIVGSGEDGIDCDAITLPQKPQTKSAIRRHLYSHIK